MHHILHNDLYFLHRTCRANPAGSVFYTDVLVHKSAFLTDFTLRTLLKHNYCVSLMFFVKIDRKFSLSTKNAPISSKTARFFQKNVSRNMEFHVTPVSLFKICTSIFRNSPKPQLMHHILHNDLHFLHRTCRANPAGSVFYTGVLVYKSAFLTDFTLRTLLKRNYCVSLMFLVKIDRKFSVSTKNAPISSKRNVFFQKICHEI